MSSCIVTCIYDLMRRSPEYFHRSGAEYACMLEYHRRFGVPVFCFTEEDMVEYLPDFVKPIVIPFEELPAKEYIPITGKGYKNVMVGNLVHEGHRLYSIVTNSKMFFMSLIPEKFDTYVWLDSGIEHGDPASEYIALESYSDIVSNPKSTLSLINYPTHINLDANMYNVASNMFSIKHADINNILDVYKRSLQYCSNIGYICLEEQVFAITYQSMKDIFSVRFTDYRILTNGKYYRSDHHVILNNMMIAPKHIANEILIKFLESLSTGNLRMNPTDILDYLIRAYYVTQDETIARIFKHLILYKNFTNNPNYKGRYDIVGKLSQHGIKLDKLDHITPYSSFHEYMKNRPFDRTIISTLV